MSFLFRKNGSSSRKRIKEKIRSRISDRGKREEERPRYDGSDSRPPPPSPWGFLFPDDFVRIDGNLKAVIVDEEGLDVIYWRKLLELENSGKNRNPRPRKSGERGDESGGGFRRSGTAESNEDEDFYGGSGDYKGDSRIEEAFSFHVKKSQSPLSSGGEIRDPSVDGARYSGYSSTSAASPSRASTSGVGDYGAVGKQPQSKFQAPGGPFPPSSPQHSLSQSSGGRSPQLPLPPGQFMAAAGPSSRPSSPFTTNQTSPSPPPSYAGGPSPPSYAGGPSPPSYTGGPSPPSYAGGPSPPSYAGGPSPPSYAGGPFPPPYAGGPSHPQSVGGPLPPPPSAGAPSPLPPSAGTPPPPPPLAGAPPPPPPSIPAKGPAPPPPPPPGKKGPAAPPPPPMLKTGPPKAPGPPKGPTKPGETSSAIGKSDDPAQPKFKPLHWDKVNPDASRSTVWNRIDGGSFNFDDNLMEALFGYVGARKSPTEAKSVSQKPIVSTTQTYILDPRKSQNKAIVLRSLGMTKEELIDLLTEGHDADADTLEKLAGIAPTPEEQSQIIDYNGDPTKLADAETLLFHILKAVPSAFNRFNVMLFKINYASEITHQKVSLQTLESACNELRARGLFMKLLEAILKAGNRMNAGTARGNAQAFNLTALRKLSDVKSVDGKTTLLHFVVEEVVRSEGKRAAMKNVSSNDEISEVSESNPENAEGSREEQEKEFVKLGLPVVGGLSSEFTSVKKAASIDYESFVGTTLALGTRLKETKRLLDQSKGKEDGCLTKLRSFFESAEEELKVIVEEQNRIIELVKRTTNYYQAGALKERNLFLLFVIIRDFLGMVDNACNEIARNQRKQRPAASGGGGSSGTGSSAASASTSTSTAAAAPSSAPQRNAVRFPILPPNFMSESSRYSSSSDSDSDS